MKKLGHILRWDNLDLLGIAFFFSILSFFSFEVIPIAVLFLYYARKHLSWMLYLLGCILFLFIWIIIAEEPQMTKMDHVGIIVDRETYEDTDRFVIRINDQKYHFYAPINTFELGDQVLIKGETLRYENSTVPYGFNPYMYYRSKGIAGKIDVESYQKIGKEMTFYQFRDQMITNLINKNVSPYVLNTLFGQSLDHQTESIYEQLGITYLLSISGLHLYVLIEIVKKILYYFSISDQKQSLIILVCYGFMAYCHRFDIGILRFFIMHGFLLLNEHFSWRKSRLELLQMTFMMMLLTNMSLLFSSGILMSYLIVTIIYLVKPWFDTYDGYLKRLLFSGFLMVWLMPFFQRFDLILVILMPILIVLIAYGLTIGSLLIGLIPPLAPLLDRYSQWIEHSLILLNKNTLPLVIPKMEMPWTFFFYLFIIAFLLVKSRIKKAWNILLCVSLLVIFSYVEKNESRLLFLDVGQGDATIVETKNCVAVIDSFSKAHDYLKHRGITHIDYLFLTHSDIDHIKEAEVILRDFHVDHMIGSAEVDSYPLYSQGMQKAKGGDQYSCGDIIFHILAPLYSYEDENNASLVIQFNFWGKQVLLTGDIEYEAEMDLISFYGHKLKSDILKIAHHGSNTSSASLFLFYVKPQLAIISAGRKNRYQFPHDEVLDRLISLDATIYRTDQQGTIIFDPNRKGEKWYFHLPFSPRFWYNMYRVRGRMYG